MRRALATLLLVGLVVTACGDDGDTGSLDDISLTAQKTQEAGSSAFVMTIEAEGTGMPQGFNIQAEGSFDYEERLGEMTMELPSVPGLGSGGGTTDIVFDETTVYMRSPMFSSISPSANEWVKIDYAALSEQSGMDLEALQQAGSQNDPTQFLQYLEGASDDGVEVVGEEEVRGASTTHYKATIDIRKALDQAPEELKPALEASLSTLEEQLGTTEFPVEVWIDEDGLLRRYVQEIAVREISQTITMELFDFGTDVEVEIPDESEVTDFSELMGGGLGTESSDY